MGEADSAIGVGALRLNPAAWTAGVTWCYLSAVANAVSIFATPGSGFLGALVGMAIAGVVLYCLYTDEVKSAFGRQASRTPAFLSAIGGSFGESAETSGSRSAGWRRAVAPLSSGFVAARRNRMT